jgi:hypothetical protein
MMGRVLVERTLKWIMWITYTRGCAGGAGQRHPPARGGLGVLARAAQPQWPRPEQVREAGA